MPSFAQRIDVDVLTRFSLAIVLAVACALPAVAQENDQELPLEAEWAAAIVMPDNPSREQAQAYYAEVVQLDKRLRERGLDYTQRQEFMASVRKFDAVPDQHIDVLLSNFEDWGWIREIDQSIARRDPKIIKPIIIAGLDEHPGNIIAIRFYGWYDDAKEPILRKLNKLDNWDGVGLGNTWLHAFTHVAEPKHYPKIKQMFVSSGRRSQQVLMLETMPGYDILDTIQTCIASTEKNLADGNPAGKRYINQEYRELERLYVLAAREGDVDSLGKLIDALNDPKHYDPYFYHGKAEIDIHRDYVAQVIDFKGSNKEILEWFKTNRDRLVFDIFKKRFVIEEDF